MEFKRIADIKRVNFIAASIRNAIPAGGEILDIGCGNGIISRAVGAYGYNVTGIDVSEKTIANAVAQNTLPNVHFKTMEAGKLNPEYLQYEAIICSEVLEHLHHPEKLLNTIYQSLKKDGILIVTVPNGRGPRELFVTRPVQQLQKGNGAVWKTVKRIKEVMGFNGTTVQSGADDLWHIRFFSRKGLLQLAADSSFKIERITASNFMEQVFPFSILTRKSLVLQKIDCLLADRLPLAFASGFMSVWKKI